MSTPDRAAMTWRKSSRSGGNGECVEVAWRKSSRSGGNGDCVEVAFVPVGVAVRDSKNADGPVLEFSPDDWRSFLDAARRGGCRRR
jgi:hypothetical protein